MERRLAVRALDARGVLVAVVGGGCWWRWLGGGADSQTNHSSIYFLIMQPHPSHLPHKVAAMDGACSIGERSAGERSPGDRSAGERSAGDRSAGDRSAGERSPGDRSAGDRSAGDRSATV